MHVYICYILHIQVSSICLSENAVLNMLRNSVLFCFSNFLLFLLSLLIPSLCSPWVYFAFFQFLALLSSRHLVMSCSNTKAFQSLIFSFKCRLGQTPHIVTWIVVLYIL